MFISGIAVFFILDECPYPGKLHTCCVEKDCALSLVTTWTARFHGMSIFQCSVRIPVTGYIPHHFCMQGLVNPSMWNSLVKLMSFRLSVSISAMLLPLGNSDPWAGRQIC